MVQILRNDTYITEIFKINKGYITGPKLIRYLRLPLFLTRYQCFKSAWIATVLHDGFGFPKTYKHFTSTQLIDGREVQWTLGALLFKTRFFPLRSVNG